MLVASAIRSLVVVSAAFVVALPGREAFAQEAGAPLALPAPQTTTSVPAPTAQAPAEPQPGSAPAPGSPVAASAPVATPSSNPAAVHASSKRADNAEFEERTFLGDGPIDHGGYGGPVVRVSSFDGEGAVFIGGRGGWLINHRLLIGAAGMGQVLNVDAPRESVDQYPRARNVEFGYGGFLIGYHVAPESRVHGVISVLLAGGGLVLSDRDVNDDDDADVGHDGDGVVVMEPELALEANLLRFMRLQFTLSYRSVWDVDLAGLDDADASGVGGGLAFLFGNF